MSARPARANELVINDVSIGVVAALRAGSSYAPADRNIARVVDGNVLGVILYSNYTGESICMHAASWHPRWVSRDFMWIAFDYPYNQLRVKRIFGHIPENNWPSLRFAQHAGFKPITRIDGVYRGGIAAVVLRQEREDCRYLDIAPRTIRSNVLDVEDDDGR